MMENLDLTLFYDESFVEFNVNDTKLNLSKRDIIISTRGAWLDRDEHNVLRAAKIFNKKVAQTEGVNMSDIAEHFLFSTSEELISLSLFLSSYVITCP